MLESTPEELCPRYWSSMVQESRYYNYTIAFFSFQDYNILHSTLHNILKETNYFYE